MEWTQASDLLTHELGSRPMVELWSLSLSWVGLEQNQEINIKGSFHFFHGSMMDSLLRRAHIYTKWALKETCPNKG